MKVGLVLEWELDWCWNGSWIGGGMGVGLVVEWELDWWWLESMAGLVFGWDGDGWSSVLDGMVEVSW